MKRQALIVAFVVLLGTLTTTMTSDAQIRKNPLRDGPGAGLISELLGTVDLVMEPDKLVLDASYIIATNSATEWEGGLESYSELRAGMTAKVTVVWRADASLLATAVEMLSLTGIETLHGMVVSGESDESVQIASFEIATGEWITMDARTILDGDVNKAREIFDGMILTADCVIDSVGDYRALWALAEDPFLIDPFADGGPGLAGEEYSRAEALVVLVDGADPTAVADRVGAAVIGLLPGTLVHLFQWPMAIDENDLVVILNDPDVVDVEPNLDVWDPESIARRLIVVDRSPSSHKYTEQAAVAQANIAEAHERTVGAGTLVAIIDTGVDPFNPLLRHRIGTGWDFLEGDNEPWETSDGIDQDDDGDIDEAAGHGTFVAGLVLLTAPEATIIPYRALNDDGYGTTFTVCQAVLAAIDRGADVINMSFAFSQETGRKRPKILDRLLDEAAQRGIVLVAGAGNWTDDDLPFPAEDHRVIAVAATDNNGALADFSNFGADVTLAAPGVELYCGAASGQFGTWSGTSMAAPLVSGAVALLRSVNPLLSPLQIETALTQASIPAAGDDDPGLIQVSAALDLVPTPRGLIQPKPRGGSSGRH